MLTSLSGGPAFKTQDVTAAGGNTAFGFQSQLRHFWPTSALSPSRKRFQGERERHQEFDFGADAHGQEPMPLLIIPQARNVQVKPAAVKSLLSAELSCLRRQNSRPQVEQCWALHPLQQSYTARQCWRPLSREHFAERHACAKRPSAKPPPIEKQSLNPQLGSYALCQKSQRDEVRYHKSNGSSYHPRDQAACTGFR